MEWLKLSAETPGVIRDENGVPIEWPLLKVGENPICQEGEDGSITLTAEQMARIVAYFAKKGEKIPLDSEHYLFELANRKQMDEAEVLRLFPGGVAALGFGTLALAGEDLRIKVKWTPTAYEFMREKIYNYFSPVIRGLEKGPLRITSVAMTNVPAINKLDALAARAETNQPATGGKDQMIKFNKALAKLLGRDSVALGAETSEEEKDRIAAEIESKATLIEQVKTLLGLAPEASLDEVIAALKAETGKAATADEKQQQLDELAATAEKNEHARLVSLGRVERKIVEADMPYVNSLDSKALKAHLDHTSPKFPARLPDQGRKGDPDALALTAEEKLICKKLRISEEDFLKERN